MKEYHERCLKCKFFAPDLSPPCGRIFGAEIHVTPYGGAISISFTPGLVPKQFEPDLEYMLSRVFERVQMVINQWPGWVKLAEIQSNNPEKRDCPGREEKEVPYLRIVR